MSIPSVLRLEEHRALSHIVLSGRVLDLGGERGSEYIQSFRGQFETTVVNTSEKARPDIIHDLEKPLPIEDNAYDHVLLINVLEHIFEYRALLREAARVLAPSGNLVIVVPFLFPVHPSPEDYRRFTVSALEKELSAAGLRDISIHALGSGVFASRYLLLDRLLPKPLRVLNFYTCRYLAYGLDGLFGVTAHIFGKKYRKEDYALGYCVIAHK